jgi:hypothetical protein
MSQPIGLFSSKFLIPQPVLILRLAPTKDDKKVYQLYFDKVQFVLSLLEPTFRSVVRAFSEYCGSPVKQ